MILQKVSRTFTGNDTVTIGSRIRGRILTIKVVAGAVTANSDLTFTGTDSAIPILLDVTVAASATTWYHPRQLLTDGADGALGTLEYVPVYLVNEAITCVSANAGTTFEITVEVTYKADT